MYLGQANMNIDLEVKTGDTVRWAWASGIHNVVSGTFGQPGTGSAFFSGPVVGPPMMFEHTFTQAGVFPYFCQQHITLGMKSMVTVVDFCYPDCDASGSLDFFDFLCFQNEFSAGTAYADCDGSGSLDFFDFLCFQNQFASGCP